MPAPQVSIAILPTAKHKLDAYIQGCRFEISGFGEAVVVPGGVLITDILLMEQEVSSASTAITPAALAAYIFDAIEQGKDPSKLKVWWHSHPWGGLFWSGTDTASIDAFNNGWMISIVGCHKGNYKSRLDLYTPFRMTVDDLPLTIHLEEPDEAFHAAIQAEIVEKVREKVATFHPWQKGIDYPFYVQDTQEYPLLADPFFFSDGW
jgi:hypothetical protein